jgi:hypothetical protein
LPQKRKKKKKNHSRHSSKISTNNKKNTARGRVPKKNPENLFKKPTKKVEKERGEGGKKKKK